MQADAFFREVVRDRYVWAVRDDDGFPAPFNGNGHRAMPFWSLKSRALRIIEISPAYANMRTASISLEDWQSRWLADLERDALRIGLNWSGARAVGYDFTASEVLNRLHYHQGTGPYAAPPTAPPA